jgi:UDP-N-acetylmuramate dehydrogenase
MVINRNVSLKSYNTFQLDVNAQILVDAHNENDLDEIFDNNEFRPLPKLILGGGSNILLTGNQRKVVIRMCMDGIEVTKEDRHHVWVKVGAGVEWHQFVLWCIETDLAGAENLSLIPGKVGAAPIQNIGAYGVELKNIFESLEAYERNTGKILTFTKDECKFGYRYSVFKGNLKDKFIITSVTFKLSKVPKFNIEYGAIRQTLDELGYDELSIRAISEAVIHIRQSKLPDPAEIGNAGSFFKNPIIELLHYEALKEAYPSIPSFPVSVKWVKIPAGWLIEKCGWKGKRRGDVGVHQNQALVLVNYGQGRGRDILKLSEMIQETVQRKFGIDLQKEVNVI